MVFTYVPAATLVTVTVTLQVPGVTPVPAGIDRPTGSVRLPAACVGAVPVHVVATVAATVVRPAGSVSTSAVLSVAAVAFGLESASVSVVVPPVARFSG